MRLGPYELVAELGRGGMAVVHRAVHVPTGATRAVKVLEAGADLDLVVRFRREAEALARVDAPDVVRIFEAGQEGGRLWLAMPLLEGARSRSGSGRASRGPARRRSTSRSGSRRRSVAATRRASCIAT